MANAPGPAPRPGPSAPQAFDAIIVGTGQAAPALANRLTQAGMRVAVIERARVGGSCVNFGCTPTKAMAASARVARMAARAAEYGVVLPGGPHRVDMAVVADRMAAIVDDHRSGLERWLGSMKGCTLIRGHATLEGPREVRVGDRLLKAGRIFLNVGARARVPDLPGLAAIRYLTNTSMVGLRELPRHLVVIGGSYIGLEFAQMFRRFGAEVTIVEKGDRLIGREDEEVSTEIASILEAEGITVRLRAECIRVEARDGGIAVGLECAAGEPTIIGSHLLLAVGRKPNTDDLGLDRAGVQCDGKGYIKVDERLRTNVEGIWALGDCNGRGAFTHTSYDDFQIVASELLDGGGHTLADRVPAYALYIDPPLGRVGMTAAQAREAGRTIRIGARPMARVARAVEKGEARGLMRVVVDAETDEMRGAAVLGPGGDEAVHTLVAAMTAGTRAGRFALTMGIHPTVSELLPTIAGELSEPLPPLAAAAD